MNITDKRHIVKIETLTPVHIGSGIFLQNNAEFIRNGSDIYIMDHGKLLDIIGEERVDYWVAAIERGDDVQKMIERIGKNAQPSQYAKRCITARNLREVKPQATLKECIHDGRGIAYIPGSSIKGAIRTAILADLAFDKKEYGDKINFSDRSNKFVGTPVERFLFGKSPNSSVFRFLQVGDAYFTTGCEVAINEVNLNIRETHRSLLDEGKSQLVEAIGRGHEAEFTIKIASEYNAFAFNEAEKKDRIIADEKKKTALKILPDNMCSVEKLFETINNSTKNLIKEEIGIWEKTGRLYDDDETAENYVNAMRKILQAAEGCKSNECVLRVGQASGWRFTTGAWIESMDDDVYYKTVSKARFNAEEYKQYDFPKTRRITDNNEYPILGFIKLTFK